MAADNNTTHRFFWPDDYFRENSEWKHTSEILRKCAGKSANSAELFSVIASFSASECCVRADKGGGQADVEHVLDRIVTEPGSLFGDFFSLTLPGIFALALYAEVCFDAATSTQQEGGSYSSSVPLLPQGCSGTVCLSRQQVASLLALMFLGATPSVAFDRCDAQEFGTPSMLGLSYPPQDCSFPPHEHKLRCFMAYFQQIVKYGVREQDGFVCIERFILGDDPLFSPPRCWSESTKPLTRLSVTSTTDSVDDNATGGTARVDFANAMVGGGVLGMGTAQEEISFCTRPEIVVAKLCCQRMRPDECILLHGARKFSLHKGFGESFQFVSGCYKEMANGVTAVVEAPILAIDAKMYANVSVRDQVADTERDLNKAFCGFTALSKSKMVDCNKVATGNWGCGAYGGCVSVKALLQWMAASQAGLDELIYHPWHDQAFQRLLVDLSIIVERHNVTVGDLYGAMLREAQLVRDSDGPLVLLKKVAAALDLAR